MPWHLILLVFIFGAMIGGWAATIAIMTSRSPHRR